MSDHANIKAIYKIFHLIFSVPNLCFLIFWNGYLVELVSEFSNNLESSQN